MDVRVERNVAVPMRDGTVLRADVFRPAPEGDYPVLLCRTPYNKSLANLSYGWLQPIRPASEGYAVVIQDVRGRFESEGTFRPFHQELDDGFDTVEWCARQPWSNGRVGMYGLSYLGATQWLAAAAQSPNLQAIFPGLTGSDFYDGWTYQGGAFELGFNLTWTALLLAMPEVSRQPFSAEQLQGIMGGLAGVAFDHWPALRHLPVRDVPAFAHDMVAPYYKEWLDHPVRDAYWEPITIESAHPKIHTPAYSLGGWFDLFIRGTVRNFAGMRENGATELARNGQKLIVGPWYHGTQLTGSAGQTVFGQAAMVLLEDLQMRFFDHWLKDVPNGIDSEPAVQLFTMGTNTWSTFDSWPPKEARATPWYFHSNGAAATARGDGVLSQEAPKAERPDTFVYDPLNPCPTVGGPLFPYPLDVPPGQYDQSAVEARPDVLCYTSAPLDRDLEVAGPVEVRLWAASSAPDTDFTAKLVDVAPDGTALNLADGIMRARYHRGFDAVNLLAAGGPVELTIDLAGTANVFKAGHRVRVEVSSSNFPRFDRNLNTGRPVATDAEARVATNTVFHDTGRPSHIVLPVIERA
ncbi:MAG: CocE/NonD family hydrolase [Dehalococcoidia bacterium]|nr:CocE/NonD family hydrolase [Dehalococcoidia bacterium]